MNGYKSKGDEVHITLYPIPIFILSFTAERSQKYRRSPGSLFQNHCSLHQ